MRELAEIKQQNVELKNQNEDLKKQYEEIIKLQAENVVLLKEMRKYHTAGASSVSRFPVENEQSLKKLENEIEEQEDEIVAAVKKIIFPGNLKNKLHQLLGKEVILKYNYDGVQGKHAFKNLKRINSVFFRASSKDGYTNNEYQEIRHAFKIIKNRHHKNECIKNKKLKDISTA